MTGAGVVRVLLVLAITSGVALAQDAPASRPDSSGGASADSPLPRPASGAAGSLGNARPPDRPEDRAVAMPPAVTPPPPDENIQPKSQGRLIPPVDEPTQSAKSAGRLTPPQAAVQARRPDLRAPSRRALLRERDADFAQCLRQVKALGVLHETVDLIEDTDDPDCGISRPLNVTGMRGGITLQGGALMRCDTARALALWTRDFVRPAARHLPGAPKLTGMQLGTTYECRGRVGSGASDAKLSEHALGNAIDIMAFEFQGQDPMPVSPRAGSGDIAESFQRAVRGSACLFFATVLGPGSNASHDNHLHLDVARRNGGWRLCE